MVRIALIGDIHGHWTADDPALLDAQGYDLIVVLGDLAGLRHAGAVKVARGLSSLRTPALFIPGNHDASHPAQLLAEVAGQPQLGNPMADLQGRRLEELVHAVSPLVMGAYSSHRVASLTVIAGRPHSMGGPTLSFPRRMADGWGVDSLEASAARLRTLIDQAETSDLIFVAHNGPAGLGATRSDIWGCDFRSAEGDWGDPDLRDAIDHALAIGKRVRLVAGGHMHRRTRGGGERAWLREDGGVTYVNAAEVPRVRSGRHHHVRVTIDEASVAVEDQWLTV